MKYNKMSATQKEQIWGFLVDALFILKVHEFVFFCTDRILGYFILKFYIHTHNILVYLYDFFQIFWKWKVRILNFSKNPASMEAELQNALLV